MALKFETYKSAEAERVPAELFPPVDPLKCAEGLIDVLDMLGGANQDWGLHKISRSPRQRAAFERQHPDKEESARMLGGAAARTVAGLAKARRSFGEATGYPVLDLADYYASDVESMLDIHFTGFKNRYGTGPGAAELRDDYRAALKKYVAEEKATRAEQGEAYQIERITAPVRVIMPLPPNEIVAAEEGNAA